MSGLAFGPALMARLDQLASFSDEADHLTRLYLSPAHRRAMHAVAAWMVEAGMSARIDPVGSVVGRYEGTRPDAPAVLIGSHIDTVIDAGRYDGALGVWCHWTCSRARASIASAASSPSATASSMR